MGSGLIVSQRHVILAIPAYTGVVHSSTVRSLLTDVLKLDKHGIAISLIDDVSDTQIEDARAIILAQFLGVESATDLIYIDNDVCWPAGTLLRMLAHPVDIVGIAYPMRVDPPCFPIVFPDDTGDQIATVNGLLRSPRMQGGFLKVSRAAAEKMVAAYQHLEFRTRPKDDGTESTPGGIAWGVFEPYRIKGTNRKLSEDYSFCQRWCDIGGDVWCDPHVTMGHTGLKTFTGSLAEWLGQGENPHEHV